MAKRIFGGGRRCASSHTTCSGRSGLRPYFWQSLHYQRPSQKHTVVTAVAIMVGEATTVAAGIIAVGDITAAGDITAEATMLEPHITAADIMAQAAITRASGVTEAGTMLMRAIGVAGIIDWHPSVVGTGMLAALDVKAMAGITGITAAPGIMRERPSGSQPGGARLSVTGLAAGGRQVPLWDRKVTATAGSAEDKISTTTRATAEGTATPITAATATATAMAGGMGVSSGCAFLELAGCWFRVGSR
jgi:hypothetical protein